MLKKELSSIIFHATTNDKTLGPQGHWKWLLAWRRGKITPQPSMTAVDEADLLSWLNREEALLFLIPAAVAERLSVDN